MTDSYLERVRQSRGFLLKRDQTKETALAKDLGRKPTLKPVSGDGAYLFSYTEVICQSFIKKKKKRI